MMQPGRELDALVAEKVMGKKLIRSAEDYIQQMEKGGDYFGREFVCTIRAHNDTFDKHRPGHTIAICPAYSSHIAAAWEVVEKLQWAEPELSWNDEQHCWCLYLNKHPHCVCPTADTAPHAICLAALKAMGVEIGRVDNAAL